MPSIAKMKEECRTAREFNGKQEEYAAIQFEFNDGGLGKAEENGLSTAKRRSLAWPFFFFPIVFVTNTLSSRKFCPLIFQGLQTSENFFMSPHFNGK